MIPDNNYVAIAEGKLIPFAAVPAAITLDVMQEILHGNIELFYRVESEHRRGVMIDFWCNEEGRLNGMKPNVLVNAGQGYVFDIVGPVLITAGDAEGNTIPMTAEELASIKLVEREGMWPVVQYVA